MEVVPSHPARRHDPVFSPGGFTLIEVVCAGAVLALFIASAVAGLSQVNRYAQATRLSTLALAAAEERINEIKTVSWQINDTRPAILTAGTTTENNLPLNNDAFATSGTFGSASSDLDAQVNATRVTQITDLNARTLRASVTVSYTYRGRNYNGTGAAPVSLITLRTTDNF